VNVESLRDSVERFQIELTREYYLAYSGRSESVDLEKVYKKYEELSDFDNLKYLLKRREDSEGEERRRLSYLAHFLAMLLEGRETISLSDKMDEKKASAKITIDVDTFSLYQASAIIGIEDNRDKRRMISEEINKITEDINPDTRKFWNLSHEFARKLGYTDYVNMYSNLSLVDYKSVCDAMKWFVDVSSDLYHQLLKDRVREEIGITLKEMEAYDTRYLLNMNSLRSYLPDDKILTILKDWTNDFKFDPTARGNIKFDIEARDRKSPRAFCAPVVIPTEVYLCIFPKGGYSSYQSLFHELGHAVHFGYTESTYPMEYKYLGDNAVTESFAFLFDHLFINRQWVGRYLKIDDIDNFLRYSLLYEIYMLRRYAGKIDYELRFHRDSNGKEEGIRSLYSEILERTTMIRQNGSYYLQDIDANMYVVCYIRAWMLEALVSTYLIKNYGDDWFINPKARDFIIDLFSMGQKYTADEIARRLGYSGLEVEVMWKRLMGVIEGV